MISKSRRIHINLTVKKRGGQIHHLVRPARHTSSTGPQGGREQVQSLPGRTVQPEHGQADPGELLRLLEVPGSRGLYRPAAVRRAEIPEEGLLKGRGNDQGSPVPVMDQAEYQTIIEALERRTQREGDRACDIAARESAKRLLPLVHFLGTYGLRIGDVLTVRLEDEDRFSYGRKAAGSGRRPCGPSPRRY